MSYLSMYVDLESIVLKRLACVSFSLTSGQKERLTFMLIDYVSAVAAVEESQESTLSRMNVY